MIPDTKIQPIDECNAGDLVMVRAVGAGGSSAAFVAQIDGHSDKYLVHLSESPNAPKPPYFTQTSVKMPVMKYKHNYSIEVNHSKYTDFRAKSWDYNGMLILSCETKTIRVGPAGEAIYGSRYYDLKSGYFVNEPNLSGAISFGSWSINLIIEGI